MQFIYVLVGWEGSAADSRVLKDALTHRNRIFLPEGKYYLVDAGYANMPGLLAPYRGTRYHLQEFGDNLSRNDKDLFNRRHSSLKNTIERTFGALKARFQMLKGCCILHNYIRKEDYNGMFELEDDDSNDKVGGGGDEVRLTGVNEDEDSDDSDDLGDEGNLSTTMLRHRALEFQDAISTSMWSDY
ncbi:protein ALP1-like [Aristolochia californica]|uniref:protein ALP1-like n=1 Tax=Aristolochia californica TaxID=171875 RepID=UPI0035DB73AC